MYPSVTALVSEDVYWLSSDNNNMTIVLEELLLASTLIGCTLLEQLLKSSTYIGCNILKQLLIDSIFINCKLLEQFL